MKKTFVILITVALLGILAASAAPSQKLTATTTPTNSTATADTPPSSTNRQYKDGTYSGTTASNYYDDIQVAVTISGGKITSLDTPTLHGNSGRSQEINGYAIPQLKDKAIAAQSSHIDGVSGASYTTKAYLSSLQSALDQAQA